MELILSGILLVVNTIGICVGIWFLRILVKLHTCYLDEKYLDNWTKKDLQVSIKREKGFIYEPPTLEEESREKIIENNNKKNRDTLISDLM